MASLLLAVIYIAFVGLGLPDSLLGSVWPAMYPELGADVSQMGLIGMTISLCTVISSLMSDRVNRRFGTGFVVAGSTAVTAVSLFGFSTCRSVPALILWAIPYGLGAGAIDAVLNDYVAIHYASRHMSWLHCMWGVGAAVGPYIMGAALTAGQSWTGGYRIISCMQAVITAILFLSVPLWKKNIPAGNTETVHQALSIPEILRLPGVAEILLSFFCYSAIEQTAGQWAASYLTLQKGVSTETAASFASMFYIGITVGRAVSGFITFKLNDSQMIRLGQVIILTGLILMLLPFGAGASLAGFILIGLGCAPIYPSFIHLTPTLFGAERSQSIIGVQMAAAYTGTTLMAPLFGLIAGRISAGLLPIYLVILLSLQVLMHERMLRRNSAAAARFIHH